MATRDNTQAVQPYSATGRGWSWSKDASDAPSDTHQDEPFTLPNDTEPIYVISVAAELSALHPQTLRAYEREGLVTPSRTQGGTRRYSVKDVERLRFIRTLTQDEGLNLAGVRIVLDLGEKLEGSRQRVRELEEMVRVLAERLEPSKVGAVVKAPPATIQVHRSSRPHASRGGPVGRARVVPPPDMQT